jgi:hypothetical protein
MIHVSNVGVLEIAVDLDKSMRVERKVQFGEGDISSVREAPLVPCFSVRVIPCSISSENLNFGLNAGAFPS